MNIAQRNTDKLNRNARFVTDITTTVTGFEISSFSSVYSENNKRLTTLHKFSKLGIKLSTFVKKKTFQVRASNHPTISNFVQNLFWQSGNVSRGFLNKQRLIKRQSHPRHPPPLNGKSHEKLPLFFPKIFFREGLKKAYFRKFT